jgi:hypothetical protein
VSRHFKSVKPARKLDPTRLRRLAGTRGEHAAVGEALDSADGFVCWELNPAYAAWFWPLMQKATGLVLSIPESELEPLQTGDCTAPPRAPTEEEKDAILKFPERAEDCARVYTLVLRGKPALVHKAFPTRTANMQALHFCRKQVGGESDR